MDLSMLKSCPLLAKRSSCMVADGMGQGLDGQRKACLSMCSASAVVLATVNTHAPLLRISRSSSQ